MNEYTNRKIKRLLCSLLAVLTISFSLTCCGIIDKPADTTSPQLPPVTLEPSDSLSFDQAELDRFLSLVDYNKLFQIEEIFEELYIGVYKPYSELVEETVKLIIETFELEKIETVDEATTAFLNAYLHVMGDKYAYYYDADAYDEYESDMQGEYAGIGVSVTLAESRYIEILTVFTDSPADKVGMLPGDLIVEINGEDVVEVGYYEAIDKVRGEIGISVNITVDRDGERISFDVTREKVTEQTVDYRLLEDNIGYIRITSFDMKTYSQFVEAYTTLESQGIEGLIFDVRNNPGGALDAVVAILEYILPDGPIVHMEYKDSSYNKTIKSVDDCSWTFRFLNTYYENHEIDMPMVVLANGNTASAGELFTSSLDDYDVATVVGVNTYGKGVGQTGIPLVDEDKKEDGSVVTITYFYYAPPYSENYNEVGITPDIRVELPEEAQKKNLYKLTEQEDTQLKAGMEEILRILKIMNTIGN